MGRMWSQAPLNCAIRTGMLWKPKPGPCSAAAVHRQRSRSATAPIRRSASRLPHKQCLTQQRRVNRYSPDSRRFRGPDRAFEWLGQRQIASPQAKGDPSGRLMAAKRLHMPLRPHQGMPLPSSPAALARSAVRAILVSAFVVIDGEKQHLGTEAVLSRGHVEGCANCQMHLEVWAASRSAGWQAKPLRKPT